jgi:hypothetical protein
LSSLDFICIGAGKSGTTSLFHYLKGHPKIFIPVQKELPLFNKHVTLSQFQDFMKRFYPENANLVKGKITPSYMTSPEIPRRIHSFMPDIKLIAILRNPIDRAFSHYLMKKRNLTDTRNFSELVINEIENQAQTNFYESYLKRGLYGTILAEYLKYFNRSQILVVFSEELKNNKEETLDRILSHIGLEKGYRPKTLNKNFYKGGLDFRFKTLHKKAKRVGFLVKGFNLLSPTIRFRIKRWYFQDLNTIKKEVTLNSEVRKILISYYLEDIKFLSKTYQLEVPWKEFQI